MNLFVSETVGYTGHFKNVGFAPSLVILLKLLACRLHILHSVKKQWNRDHH